MFGYPGGAIMPFYDALHGQQALRHILVRHEQAAAHAADGYARAANRRGRVRRDVGSGRDQPRHGIGHGLHGRLARPRDHRAGRPADAGRDAFQRPTWSA